MPRDRFFVHIYLHAYGLTSFNSSYFWLRPFIASGDMPCSVAEGDTVLFIEWLLSIFFANIQHSEPQIALFRLNETHSDHMPTSLRDTIIKNHLLIGYSYYFTDHWSVYFEAFIRSNVFTEYDWHFSTCCAYLFHSGHENLVGTDW